MAANASRECRRLDDLRPHHFPGAFSGGTLADNVRDACPNQTLPALPANVAVGSSPVAGIAPEILRASALTIAHNRTPQRRFGAHLARSDPHHIVFKAATGDRFCAELLVASEREDRQDLLGSKPLRSQCPKPHLYRSYPAQPRPCRASGNIGRCRPCGRRRPALRS